MTRALWLPWFACLVMLGMKPVRAQAPAPDVIASLVRTDVNGQAVRLDALRGHVLVVNFWATWCVPCLSELPVLSDLQRTLGAEGVQVLGVSMDETAAAPRELAARQFLTYPVVMWDRGMMPGFGQVLGLPVTVVFDRQGVLRKRFDGPLQLEAIRAEVNGLLH